MSSTTISELLSRMTYSLNTVLLGKDEPVKLSIACMLAKGHLLIEDLPGMGKTTLAHGIAKILGLDFQRVQFTSDLLPSDVVGVNIYNPKTGEFDFRPGPVFTQILLADEVNRTSPKTQSALLEAMSENQVTIEGVTRELDDAFFVLATQNSQHQTGTFPLPESQLDRFMMRISLGYPDVRSERELLEGVDPRKRLKKINPIVSRQQLNALQMAVNSVKASEQLLDYLQRLLAYTREMGEFSHGLSPRAALAWLQCAKAYALLSRRNHVLPDDIQQLMVPVAGHRLMPAEPLDIAAQKIQKIITAVPVIQ